MTEYNKKIQDWKQLEGGLKYTWLVDYLTYSAFGTFELSPEDWEKRDLIANFKGNSELTTEIDHQQAVDKAIAIATQFIKDTFGDEAKDLTLVCVPAKKECNTQHRFERFSQEVCAQTGMENAYGHITEDFVKGKDVVIFDDIIASGGSISKFAAHIKTLGANIICAIALGKTISNGYDQGKD